MTSRFAARAFQAIACCFILLLIPLPQVPAQSGNSGQRDPNGDIQNDLYTDLPILREKPQNSAAPREDSANELPQTAGALPLLGFIGMASLVGAGAARLSWKGLDNPHR